MTNAGLGSGQTPIFRVAYDVDQDQGPLADKEGLGPADKLSRFSYCLRCPASRLGVMGRRKSGGKRISRNAIPSK